jgi:hypothetical protein
MNRSRRFAYVSLVLGFIYLGSSGKKSGCSDEEIATLTSPVQAVATIYHHSDGAVEADLTLISTSVNPSVFVNEAESTKLRVIGTAGEVASVALVHSAKGHYTATSTDQPALVWEPGIVYAFDFDLEEDTRETKIKGGKYSAQVTAPDGGVTLEVSEAPLAPLLVARITITGAYQKGLLRVFGPDGDETYSNWNMEHPDFDGSKWNSLVVGGTHTIAAAAFPVSGSYTITFGACSYVSGFDSSLSADLGLLSGFLACEGTEIDLEVP